MPISLKGIGEKTQLREAESIMKEKNDWKIDPRKKTSGKLEKCPVKEKQQIRPDRLSSSKQKTVYKSHPKNAKTLEKTPK